MKLVKASILIVVFSTILASAIAVDSTIITGFNIAGQEIEIRVTEGEEWDHKLRVIRWLPFIRVTNQPQMAFWIEDSDGEYLKTLYVTQGVAKQDWRKAPSDPTPEKRSGGRNLYPIGHISEVYNMKMDFINLPEINH